MWRIVIAWVLVLSIATNTMAAISFVNETTSTGTGATSVPSGVTNGDLLIASCNGVSADMKITGWNDVPNLSFANTGPNLSAVYRIASSEPASYTFANTGSTSWCVMLDYTGVNQSTPIDISNNGQGTSTNPTGPSITTTVANDWLINLFTWCAAFTSGVSGETMRADQTSCSAQWSGWSGDKSLGAAGATGAQNIVAASSAWAAGSIAIEASVATPTPTPTQTPTPTPTPTQTPTPVPTSIAQHPCFMGGRGGICP